MLPRQQITKITSCHWAWEWDCGRCATTARSWHLNSLNTTTTSHGTASSWHMMHMLVVAAAAAPASSWHMSSMLRDVHGGAACSRGDSIDGHANLELEVNRDRRVGTGHRARRRRLSPRRGSPAQAEKEKHPKHLRPSNG